MPFRRKYRSALSDTFDIYLAILHDIDQHVHVSLGCADENWRVLNACPPCNYEVQSLHCHVMQQLLIKAPQLEDETPSMKFC
jgi:hypothetical protein